MYNMIVVTILTNPVFILFGGMMIVSFLLENWYPKRQGKLFRSKSKYR